MATSRGVSVKVRDHGTIRRLRSFARKVGDFEEPLKQSGIYMQQSIQMRFRNNNWKPLSPTTIKIRPKRAGGKPLLDTGKLRMSVTSSAVKQVSKTKLTYGTNLVYAPMHNFGGRGGWGYRIPQREFLYFDERDEAMIRRIFEDYVRRESP